MKNLFPNVLLFPALIALSACAASAPVASSNTAAPDTARRGPATAAPEDLSRYRPVFTAPKPTALAPGAGPKTVVTPTNQVNAQIEQRLRDQAFTNQNVKYAQGFRILAYVGLEREQAMAIRRAIISRYPEETDYLTFRQPVYRLWVGDYLTRLEAEQAMLRLRPLAPKAELEPTQVLLNKTTF
ncbi:sporulation protein [Hymenobacter persicinus]|uniref:Sporulation protein n=1 Tax=Hymenobacter persicinus TaxID=2025506 RepID=A0A4Q5LFW7_9BACT|nr:sporulation protein [Hymenobacter persicinus]RYU84331.1 sporulation protein [Hymenobacter persicinus]